MSVSLDQVYDAFMVGVYGELPDARAADFISASASMTPEQALGVYRASVRESLVAALQAIYPALMRGMGEAPFRRLAVDYVAQAPSRSTSLDDYGASFPAFVQQHPALTDYPYLGDLARLDWAWHRVFHAADHTPIPAARLAELVQHDSDALRLHLSPRAALITSDWPLYDIWRMNRALTSEREMNLHSHAQSCLVWRQGLEVMVALASPCDLAIYTSCDKPEAFGTKVDALLSNFDATHVVESLILALNRGWLVASEVV